MTDPGFTLLIIDAQNDYLAAAGLIPSRTPLIQEMSRLLAVCRSGGAEIIHVWTTVRREHDERMPHWKAAGKWICVEGSPGHEPPEALKPSSNEQVVHKTGFSAFAGTSLAEKLGDRHQLIIAGIHLHSCVRATALDAHQSGIPVVVVADAVGSDDPAHSATTRRYLADRGIEFLTIDEIECRLRGSTNARTVVVSSPWNGEVTARFESASAKEITSACEQASRTTAVWRSMGLEKRIESLQAFSGRIADQAEDLANMMAIDVGKPITQARAEMRRTSKLVETAIMHARGPGGEGDGWRKVPLGVVAAITPWNNPVAIPMGKIAPALLHGNTMVWKPSPQASRVAAAIHALALETLPGDVLHVIFGDDRTARELMSHSLVDAISITGSEAAGTAAQEIASRRHLPLQAELGGNNAAIVWLDADLASSAAALAHGAFDFAGQRCTATRRLILHAAIYDQFLDLFTTEVDKLRRGNPLDEATDIGPVVGNTAARIEALCRDAQRTSETVVGGGLRPVIVLCSDSSHEHFQEESFGPLAVICRAADWVEAITLCNGVRQGLAAALFTKSDEMAKRFLDQARVGILKINLPTSDAAADLPFGGWKSSGIGPAEHGVADREFFTRYQAIYR